jgi:hypothetical protein
MSQSDFIRYKKTQTILLAENSKTTGGSFEMMVPPMGGSGQPIAMTTGGSVGMIVDSQVNPAPKGIRKGPYNALYKNLPNVLNQQDYIQYKQFGLVNTIPKNTIPSLIQYTDPNKTIVWDMLKKTNQQYGAKKNNNQIDFNINIIQVSNCPPPFIVCSGTNARSNREPITNPLQRDPTYNLPLELKTGITYIGNTNKGRYFHT